MTEQPPIQPTPVGALRFNTDIAQLEYFDGNQYVNITTDSPTKHTGGTRGIFAGGNDTIDFVNIATTGNAKDFGDMAMMTNVTGLAAGGSNGHGGLSG